MLYFSGARLRRTAAAASDAIRRRRAVEVFQGVLETVVLEDTVDIDNYLDGRTAGAALVFLE